MIVLKISLTPKYPLKAPGIAPQSPPPTAPARIISGIMRIAGSPGRASAAPVANSAPIAIWPSPPMLKTFARNAIQIPTPTSSSGTAFTAVALRA